MHTSLELILHPFASPMMDEHWPLGEVRQRRTISPCSDSAPVSRFVTFDPGLISTGCLFIKYGGTMTSFLKNCTRFCLIMILLLTFDRNVVMCLNACGRLNWIVRRYGFLSRRGGRLAGSLKAGNHGNTWPEDNITQYNFRFRRIVAHNKIVPVYSMEYLPFEYI